MSSRILITGANGQLGRALVKRYPEAKALDRDQLDITNQEQIENYPWQDIDVIINAAAYTNVDGAETSEGRVSAWRINASGTANLVKAAISNDLVLVHVSTDYVFDGSKENHQEDEPLSPIGVYGQSKAAADIAALIHKKTYIIRTSWVIGDRNFAFPCACKYFPGKI